MERGRDCRKQRKKREREKERYRKKEKILIGEKRISVCMQQRAVILKTGILIL